MDQALERDRDRDRDRERDQVGEVDRELDRSRQPEPRLGAELSQVLRAAAEALERLAPSQFEHIGARALDLDTLMIHAIAAAALPDMLARFGGPLAPTLPEIELYSTSDWAATSERLQSVAGRREITSRLPREVPIERATRRLVYAGERAADPVMEDRAWHR